MRKILSLVLCLLLLSSNLTLAAPTKNDISSNISALERDLYGQEQRGSVMDRLNALEYDIVGQHYSGGLASRLNLLEKIVYESQEQPSLLAQMNAIEWSVNQEVSATPLTERIDSAELALSGQTNDGTLRERIAELSSLAFGSVTIPMEEVSLPKNTLIKIALVSDVNAKNIVVGDKIPFKVNEDVLVNDVLVFAAGEPGFGTVTKVKQAKNFGRNAEVEIDFNQTKTIDGKFVNTFVGEEAKAEMKHLAYATGASLAGMLVLGPVGIVVGALVHGKNIEWPAGSQAIIQTSNDEKIWGLNTAASPPVAVDSSTGSNASASSSNDEGVDLSDLY